MNEEEARTRKIINTGLEMLIEDAADLDMVKAIRQYVDVLDTIPYGDFSQPHQMIMLKTLTILFDTNSTLRREKRYEDQH